MTLFSQLTNEQLADEITTWSGRVAAGEAHQLSLIGEFDRREAWSGPGLLSCAHWLSWRTGLGLTAARERVRVAARLRELPEVEAAFSAGRISWSQVRAVTRVAATEDGIDWVDLARHSSGSQLERIWRGVRRGHRIAEQEADPELAAYRIRTTKRYAEDGNLVITIRANAEDGAVVLAGLQAVAADLEQRRAATGDDSAEAPVERAAPAQPARRPRVTEADALLEMAAARRTSPTWSTVSTSPSRGARCRWTGSLLSVDPSPHAGHEACWLAAQVPWGASSFVTLHQACVRSAFGASGTALTSAFPPAPPSASPASRRL